jgi:hypothetical protein
MFRERTILEGDGSVTTTTSYRSRVEHYQPVQTGPPPLITSIASVPAGAVVCCALGVAGGGWAGIGLGAAAGLVLLAVRLIIQLSRQSGLATDTAHQNAISTTAEALHRWRLALTVHLRPVLWAVLEEYAAAADGDSGRGLDGAGR